MLTGKTALITGGSSGIGLASAQKLAASGARVAITGTSVDKLYDARVILGDGHLALQADVCSANDRATLRDRIEKEFGSLNILFANAGIAYGTPIEATDEEMFDKLMNVNVKGVFFTIQSLLPLMSSGSSIILNTSWLNQVGLPGRAVLAASKAAVRSFARTLSAELLGRNIRVNAISPGSIETPIHRKGQSDDEFAAYKSRVGAQAPIGRMGRPDEIAGAVLFLASQASSYMLGAEIVIDGGRADL